MQTLSRIVLSMGIAMSLCIATPAFAESAPVYDVDSMPQQFDEGDQSQQQDLPPPPAPGQEGAYVPSQATNSSAPRLESPTNAGTSSMTVEQRVKRVEQQVSNMQNNDTTARIDALQNQVQT